jgi:hypothetical protein
VQFLSGSQGIIYSGRRAIQIALRLDQSAERFATNEIAAGYLQQKGGEPMSGEELGEMAAAWAANRRTNAIGALNELVSFESFDVDPSKLQLVEGREYQTKELSRLMDIPAYLLAIDQSGMTYANAQQARQDLILFGARPILHAIEERLSMDDVLPRGRHVRFAIDEYLEDFTYRGNAGGNAGRHRGAGFMIRFNADSTLITAEAGDADRPCPHCGDRRALGHRGDGFGRPAGPFLPWRVRRWPEARKADREP